MSPNRRSSFIQGLTQRFQIVAIGVPISFGICKWLATQFWLCDLVCNFQFQCVAGLIGLMLLAGLLRRWKTLAFLVVATLCFGWPLMDYWTARLPASTANQPSVKLLTQNVLTENRNHEALLDLIQAENPDVIVLLETSPAWFESCKGLRERYPYFLEQAHPGNFGISFYSRISCKPKLTFHGRYELPTVHADLEVNEKKSIHIAGIHPLPPMRPQTMRDRDQLCEAVMNSLDSNRPRLVTGDFNLTPWSPKFGKLLKLGQLVDAAKGFGPEPTWFVGPSWMGGLKIDHALVSPDVRVDSFRIGPNIGSDHRAVIVEISLGE